MKRILTIELLRDFAQKTMASDSKVWLYGSRARGDSREYSDWDLLLLLNKDAVTDEDFDKYANPFILFGCQFGEDVSPQLYTFNEWDERKITPYYENVEHDKKWIYGT